MKSPRIERIDGFTGREIELISLREEIAAVEELIAKFSDNHLPPGQQWDGVQDKPDVAMVRDWHAQARRIRARIAKLELEAEIEAEAPEVPEV